MITVYACMAEQYERGEWSLLGEYDSFEQIKDELTSPTFYVSEFMIVKVVRGAEIFTTMFYSKSEWLSLDSVGKAGSLFDGVGIGNGTVIEWWRTINSVTMFINGLQRILDKQRMIELLGQCIVNFCNEYEMIQAAKICSQIVAGEKRTIKYTLTPDLQRSLFILAAPTFQPLGVVNAVRMIVENTRRIDSMVASKMICYYIRTQITLPIFLAALAKKIQR